jgi:dienelactone hydrolase
MYTNEVVLRACKAMGLVLALLLGSEATRAAGPQPIEHFTKPPAIERVVPSPSGRRVALLVAADGRQRLAVLDLPPTGPPKVIGGFDDAVIVDVKWVNEERLVFDAYRTGSAAVGVGGWFAVNADGSERRGLISWSMAKEENRILPRDWRMGRAPADSGHEMRVYRRIEDASGDVKGIHFSALDTRTGLRRNLSEGTPEGSWNWKFGTEGQPRVVTTYHGGRQKIHARLPEQASWTVLEDWELTSPRALEAWHLESDERLLVSGALDRDTSAIYAYDLRKGKLDPQPVIALEGFDLEHAGALVDSRTGRLLGVRLRTERPMTYWFDAELQAVQRAIDTALPGRFNMLHCGRCETAPYLIVESSSDRQAGEFFLLDRERARLTLLGAARPWLDETEQGTRTFHRVRTRDGLSMPVYVTHPAGAPPDERLPAVVLVSRGLFQRGTDLRWQADAQFLASRGYRVIQPEFRGTTGYGQKHHRAGFREWGHAMQDDLVDAVKWAADAKLVDPARVCIMGFNYGGYSALMGPIRHPGAYRCAVSYGGVTDIGLLYDIWWSSFTDDFKQHAFPPVFGDKEADAERLREASPLRRVAELKVPVLLAHGVWNRQVPKEHALEFVSAARDAGAQVEYVEYAKEAGGFFSPESESDFLGRVEKFLARTLSGPK